jgi:tetratricopeptide (TPR) repeat protein
MDKKRSRIVWIMIAPLLLCGCSHSLVGSTFKEANELFTQGSYKASLNKYEQIVEKYPAARDRVLFEMGIIHAYPSNEQRDYQKALGCFQNILKDYPESRYRQDSAEMISHINNVTVSQKKIIAQQTQIARLEQELKNKENEIIALGKKIEALDLELENRFFAIPKGPASRVLIEKKERRLTLLSGDRALRSYRIALGGNPNGPKEKKGDNKTPEGTYMIDGRNRDSRYHLSLRVSYPNEKDKRRARELGVAPGGDIMIHGLKNGFSWVGDSHSELDWTRGCVAVTDEEIEEIAQLVPNGTVVEIRP